MILWPWNHTGHDHRDWHESVKLLSSRKVREISITMCLSNRDDKSVSSLYAWPARRRLIITDFGDCGGSQRRRQHEITTDRQAEFPRSSLKSYPFVTRAQLYKFGKALCNKAAQEWSGSVSMIRRLVESLNRESLFLQLQPIPRVCPWHQRNSIHLTWYR